jgi:hypothetical protein
MCTDDGALSQIAAFRCADQKSDHQVEVERWIQNRLVLWAFDPGAASDEPQILATLDGHTGELIGLFAHEHACMKRGDKTIAAEVIMVVAVGLGYQGRRDNVDNRRYSDIVMSSGLQAIEMRTPPSRRIFGRVHIDNESSFRLLERHRMSRRIALDAVTVLVTHG